MGENEELNEDLRMVREILADLADRLDTMERQNAVIGTTPPDFSLAASYPIGSALAGVLPYLDVIDIACSRHHNRFTRSAVYTLLADLIETGLAYETWVAGSEPSWRSAMEALRTRAAEVAGDHIGTDVPVFTPPSGDVSGSAAHYLPGGNSYGVLEHACNVLGSMLRPVMAQYKAQSKDRDLGPAGEQLTVGECLRICETAIAKLITQGVLPAAGAFRSVRYELRSQYTAMGEGVFGPINIPAGDVPWSWAAGGV